jgi:hypothetical protein
VAGGAFATYQPALIVIDEHVRAAVVATHGRRIPSGERNWKRARPRLVPGPVATIARKGPQPSALGAKKAGETSITPFELR